MGRKINPIGYRLGSSKKWNSQWFAEKRYTSFIKEDLYIEIFFKNFFGKKRAIISNLVIQRTFSETQVFIWIFQSKKKYFKKQVKRQKSKYKNQLNKKNKKRVRFIRREELFLIFAYLKKINTMRVRIYLKKINTFRILNKVVRRSLSRFKSRKYFKSALIVIEGALFSQSSLYLCKYISNQLERDIRQKDFFFFLRKALSYYKDQECLNLKGYHIQFKGKFDKKRRSQKRIINEGEVSLNSITSNINYSYSPAHTSQGVCGVKVWLCFYT